MRRIRQAGKEAGLRRFWSYLGQGGVLAACLFFLLSCGSARLNSSSPQGPTWVARSGDRLITVKEFQAYLEQQCQRNPHLQLTPARKRELLEKYWEKKLLVAEVDRLGLNQEPEALRELQEMKEQILVKHLISRKAAEFDKQIKVSDEEIRSFYGDMRREIRFRYLPVSDPGQASEILARWKDEKPPVEMVDSGMVKLASLGEAWKQQLRGLARQKPQLLKVGSDLILVQVLEDREAPALPLDQVKEEISKELMDHKKKDLLQKWVSSLKGNGPMEINDAYDWR